MEKLEFTNNVEAVKASIDFINKQGYCTAKSDSGVIRCVHRNDEGRRCAFAALMVGRLPEGHKFWSIRTGAASTMKYMRNHYKQDLPEDISKLDDRVLSALQSWHDRNADSGEIGLDVEMVLDIAEAADNGDEAKLQEIWNYVKFGIT